MFIERRSCLRLILAVPLHAALYPAIARAEPPPAAAPEALMRKTIDRVFAVLRDQTLAGGSQRARRIAALRRIADEVFDWSEMARSSLGVHWRGLDGAQRDRFVNTFKDVLAAQYMDDLDRFQGTETVTLGQSLTEGDEVLVRSTLVTASRERVPMHYRMRAAQGTWRIVDFSIEGVSLVNHFRKSFTSALANMTIEELIERLQRQLPAAG